MFRALMQKLELVMLMGMRPCGEDDQRIVLQPELSVRNIYLNYQ
jgi:hypothetical protein